MPNVEKRRSAILVYVNVNLTFLFLFFNFDCNGIDGVYMLNRIGNWGKNILPAVYLVALKIVRAMLNGATNMKIKHWWFYILLVMYLGMFGKTTFGTTLFGISITNMFGISITNALPLGLSILEHH